MAAPESITQWIEGLKEGDQMAAQKLWDQYFNRLVRLLGKRLPGHIRRAFDEEDVALSAFKSFCGGVEAGRFPKLSDQDNLWSLLVVIANRKAQAYLRHHNRLKRGGGQVLGESAVSPKQEDVKPSLDQVLQSQPTPEFEAQLIEEYENLLNGLNSEELRTIAEMKMQGFTVDEIAGQLGSTRRTIERRLQIIRRTWAEECDQS